MSPISLHDFASKVRAKGRISFGDVQRLRRDHLADALGSREEVEILISLDREIGRVDSAWGRWLVAVVVDFVVWTERPTGIVGEDTAIWLSETLNGEAGIQPKPVA